MPVKRGPTLAMLKVAKSPEEIQGAALMTWWDGRGAAPVLAHEGPALLLERAASADGLVPLARGGRDDQALEIFCRTVATLHAPRPAPAPKLFTLTPWFRSLATFAGHDPRLDVAWRITQALLSTPRDVAVLHGDIHHENILDFGGRGWLAIDPKGLIGERAYDYANIFRNPDLETALAPGRMAARLARVSTLASLDPARLLDWIIAHAALSVAWSMEDGRDAPMDALDAALSLRAA